MDVINQIENCINSRVKTHHFWSKLLSIGTLSTVVQDKYFTTNDYSDLYPNLYFLQIGPSGVANKSASQHVVCEILDETKTVLREKYNENIIMRAPDNWTIEALIQYLNGSMKTADPLDAKAKKVGVIIKDEFSRMLKDTTDKKYMTTLAEDMSLIYDGQKIDKITRTFQQETVQKGTYRLSLIAATTPAIYSHLKLDMVVQGFLPNRFLMCEGINEEVQKRNEKQWVSEYKRKKQLADEIHEIAENLAKIRMEGKFDCIYCSEGTTIPALIEDFSVPLREYQVKSYKDGKYEDFRASYASRQTEKVLKIATLKHAERWLGTLFNTFTEDDISYGISIVNEANEHYKKIMDAWSNTDYQPIIRSQQNMNIRMLDFIESLGGTASRSKIMNRFQRWGRKQVDEVLDTLVASCEIVMEANSSGAIVYHSKDFEAITAKPKFDAQAAKELEDSLK